MRENMSEIKEYSLDLQKLFDVAFEDFNKIPKYNFHEFQPETRFVLCTVYDLNSKIQIQI